MTDLSGKKLLVVSGDSNDRVFVETAREMGLYVVCCDGHTDWSRSPAKPLADEAWDIDYSKTEIVAEKCRENGIDGVIAGYSEDRVMAACRISKAIGTPFYATEEQIEITRNKRLFKDLCKKYGVAVPKDYILSLPLDEAALAGVDFPVIVKPSDSGGRKGISVCTCREELAEAVALASEQSKNSEVVVEDYLSGTELLAVYTMADGKVSLSCLNDKYISEDQNGVSRLCDFVLTPSKYYDLYMQTVDEGIRTLLKGIGAENGVANFQFIVNEKGIIAFEMGYRVNGNDDFKVIRSNNGLDFLKMLIHHSVTGSMGDDLSRDNPQFSKYNCTLCMYLHGGTVGKIEYSGIIGKENIDDICILRKPGDVIIEDGTTKQKALLIKMSSQTLPELIDLVHFVQANITIKNTDGEDMLLKAFNTDRLNYN